MDAGLRGKSVLVTGASGGIGQAAARAFADEGARVVAHYHTQAEVAQRIVDELSTPSVALGADLRDEGQVARLFSEAAVKLGAVDVAVVNAGIYNPEPALLCDMSLEQWQATLDADLRSAFLTCREFLRQLRDQPREAAALVLVGSTAAMFGEAEHADYAAAKAAMVYGLTRSLKNEIVRFAPRGRVNCVCPGWTRTPMAEFGLQDEQLVRRIQATMPLQKIAEPEDVAAMIVVLSSDRLAGHISGAIIPIAGGMEGRLLNPVHGA